MKKIILLKIFVMLLGIYSAYSQWCPTCIYFESVTAQFTNNGCTVNVKFTMNQPTTLARAVVQKSINGTTWIDIAQFCSGTSCDPSIPVAGTLSGSIFNYADPFSAPLTLASNSYFLYRIQLISATGGAPLYSIVVNANRPSNYSSCTPTSGNLCTGTLAINGPSTIDMCDGSSSLYSVTGTTPQTTTWNSSNTAIATIDNNGTITSISSAGTFTITATQPVCSKTATKIVTVTASSCTDTCNSIKFYNIGSIAIPSGRQRFGIIYAGSSYGTGGAGIVTINSTASTNLVASQKVDFVNDFNGTVTGDGMLDATIISCPFLRPATTLELKELKLFPNPANNAVQISISNINPGQVNIEVVDINGNRVLQSNELAYSTGTYTTSINTSTLPNGVYFISIRSDGYNKAGKIVILR